MESMGYWDKWLKASGAVVDWRFDTPDKPTRETMYVNGKPTAYVRNKEATMPCGKKKGGRKK